MVSIPKYFISSSYVVLNSNDSIGIVFNKALFFGGMLLELVGTELLAI